MKLLLDTHVLLWAAFDDKRLSDVARSLISDENNALFCSVASIWEISVKHAIRPEEISFSGNEFADHCRSAGYRILSIREEHVRALETLRRDEEAPRHKDPFDRIMIAQAKAENLIFLSHDSLLDGYHEPFIFKI